MDTILRGTARDVLIGANRPFIIIGEKINPTGNKKLGAALQDGNLDLVRNLALRQVAYGADASQTEGGVPGEDDATAEDA